MNRIELKFKELRAKNKKAFIAFITAGFPGLKVTEGLIEEFSRIGVDIIELGVPFSDPLADGPVIQDSSQYALERGVNLSSIFKLVKSARKNSNVPICLMSYYNPILHFGQERFVNEAVLAGVDGVIIPDIPPEEEKEFIKLANSKGLDVILFLAPTSSEKRIRLVSRLARGFIYYVSLTGVTGARRELPAGLKSRIARIKRLTDKPVCVGFGISSASQVRSVSAISDGAIVGSAIVKMIKDNLGKGSLVRKTSSFVKKLKG